MWWRRIGIKSNGGVCKTEEVRERLGQRVGDFIALESNITRYPGKYNIKISLVKGENNEFDA